MMYTLFHHIFLFLLTSPINLLIPVSISLSVDYCRFASTTEETNRNTRLS